MSKENFVHYAFENNVLRYKSYLNAFTQDLFNKFEAKSKEIGLQSKIDNLFNGKKVNYTEDLAAWHPKYRNDQQINNNDLKYYELFQSAKNIVTIGIGGSFEGPKLLLENAGITSRNYIFVTGSDPEEFKEKTKTLIPRETIFIVSSKSFTTEETIITFNNALRWSGDINMFIAVTANKAEATKYNINNIIEFDREIGGRYSVWSDISIAAHWENNIEFKKNFLLGGKQADIDLREDNDYYRFVKYLSYSDIWLHNSMNKNTRAVLSYIWKFRSFPNYVQQLEMESLGKQPNKNSEFKKTGQIIFGGFGPTAQHSYFQLLHQGTQDICADIIASENDTKSLAYAQALTQAELLSNGTNDFLQEEEKINGNVPVNLFILKNEDSFSLAYLLATWEHRTYITSIMLGINPFDQFGVNAGKIYTNKYQVNKD